MRRQTVKKNLTFHFITVCQLQRQYEPLQLREEGKVSQALICILVEWKKKCVCAKVWFKVRGRCKMEDRFWRVSKQQTKIYILHLYEIIIK